MIKNIFFIMFSTIIFSSCTLSDFNRDNFVKTSSSVKLYWLSSFRWRFIFDLYSSIRSLIFGSYLADFIGQDDYYFYKQETLKTLEINDNNTSLVTGYWKNPKSGNTGVIKIKGYYGKPNCRLIEHIYINQNNIAQNSFDTACRAESGQWAMIK